MKNSQIRVRLIFVVHEIPTIIKNKNSYTEQDWGCMEGGAHIRCFVGSNSSKDVSNVKQ